MLPELLLDIDGVAANFIEGCRPTAERILGRPVHHDEVDQFMIERALGMDEEQTKELYRHVIEEGWCRSLPAYEGAKEAVAEIRTWMTVVPVTSHLFESRHWVFERDEWILEHLGIPKTDIVHTHRKFQVDGDVLVDDKPSHIKSWLERRPLKRAVLFNRRYNEREVLNVKLRVERIDGWPALVEYMRDVFGGPNLKTISLEGRQP